MKCNTCLLNKCKSEQIQQSTSNQEGCSQNGQKLNHNDRSDAVLTLEDNVNYAIDHYTAVLFKLNYTRLEPSERI